MDSWCSKLRHNGKDISGGAAREARIKAIGGRDGNDAVVKEASTMAAEYVVAKATAAAEHVSEGKTES